MPTQHKSTTSRQLLDLGVRNRDRDEGFGLVEPVPDAIDMRIKRYRLTPAGRELLNKMLEALR